MLKFGLLLLSALLLAAANAIVNPETPAWSADALKEGELSLSSELVSSGSRILWLDAREESEYQTAHIPGALLLNESKWDELLSAVLDAWEPGRKIVVYCSSRQCQASHAVAERLRSEMAIKDVFVLKGGWEAWRDPRR